MANFKVDSSQNQWLNQMSESQKAQKAQKAEGIGANASLAQAVEDVKAQINDKHQINNLDSGSAFGNIDFINLVRSSPETQIETLRKLNATDSPKFALAMMEFPGKLDQMSKHDLQAMRDYLVNEMASPLNNDDPFLGVLLDKVNQELDSRKSPRPWDWEPLPKPVPKPNPWDPMPPQPEPLPYPRGGGWPGRVLD